MPVLATISMYCISGCAAGDEPEPVVLDLGDLVGVAEPGAEGDLAVTLEEISTGDQVAAAWWDGETGAFQWSIEDGVGGQLALDITPTPASAIAILFARYQQTRPTGDEVGYSFASCYWNCYFWTWDIDSCALGCDAQN